MSFVHTDVLGYFSQYQTDIIQMEVGIKFSVYSFKLTKYLLPSWIIMYMVTII